MMGVVSGQTLHLAHALIFWIMRPQTTLTSHYKNKNGLNLFNLDTEHNIIDMDSRGRVDSFQWTHKTKKIFNSVRMCKQKDKTNGVASSTPVL